MTPEKIPFCECDKPSIEKPHLDDAGVDWCDACGLILIQDEDFKLN